MRRDVRKRTEDRPRNGRLRVRTSSNRTVDLSTNLHVDYHAPRSDRTSPHVWTNALRHRKELLGRRSDGPHYQIPPTLELLLATPETHHQTPSRRATRDERLTPCRVSGHPLMLTLPSRPISCVLPVQMSTCCGCVATRWNRGKIQTCYHQGGSRELAYTRRIRPREERIAAVFGRDDQPETGSTPARLKRHIDASTLKPLSGRQHTEKTSIRRKID